MSRAKMKWEYLDTVGDCQYGDIILARHSETGQFLVVRSTPIITGEVPSAVEEEIRTLRKLDHPNIIRLLDVVRKGIWMYFVFEGLPFLLSTLIKHPERVQNPLPTKYILQQILRGVKYLQSEDVLHQDLKPELVLFDPASSTVKLAYCGLARDIVGPHKYRAALENHLWYKGPEVYLGSKKLYAVTMWSVGCIFGEMVTRKPLFDSQSHMGMLVCMTSFLGIPNPEALPDSSSESGLVEPDEFDILKTVEYKDLTQHFVGLEPAGVDLLSKMLCMHPGLRITADDALEHEYFRDLA